MAISNTVSSLQGIRRRVVYVTLYELIAIVVATFGLAALTGQNASHASVASVAASVIAVLWNIGFNWAFRTLGVAPGGAGTQRQAPHCPRHRL